MQYQAGYILDGIRDFLIDSNFNSFEIDSMLYALSFFEIDTNANLKQRHDVSPIFDVANNIITRGLPTRPTLNINKNFVDIFNYAEIENTEIGDIKFKIKIQNSDFASTLFNSLHIIDPKYTTEYQETAYNLGHFNKLGSEAEKKFIFKLLPNHIGDFFTQLIEPQKSIESLLEFVKNSDSKINTFIDRHFLDILTTHSRQDVDFALEFPFPIKDKNGIIIEIDGRQHHEFLAQANLDIQRDNALKTAKYYTQRIGTSELGNISQHIQPIKKLSTEYPYFQTLFQNFQSPLYKTAKGIDALQLILSPFAIARIQKTLLELVFAGVLKLSEPIWKICIIERDIPAANLAINDFKELLQNLISLAEIDINIPNIELVVISTDDFKNSKINLKTNPNSKQIDNIKKSEFPIFDLIIDISILRRNGFELENKENIEANYFVKIRSSHSLKSKRKFQTNSLIPFKEIGIQKDENFIVEPVKKEILEYFIQSFFRKETFRPGQLPILNRALQGKSVIGLLPTGGGKSLTYQLASLLQPGITLIIDPIKSLMKDQNDGLKRNLIDATVFINSSLKTAEDRKIAIDKLKNAEVLFCFISPERMQIAEFRRNLAEMHHKYKSYFSYCVVDEAHCVSEWGHDFRTSYLRLGDNTRNFCKPKFGIIPIFGLTATASFDVLTDVQRELEISDEDIVRDDPSNRTELFYKVLNVDINDIAADNHYKYMQSIGNKKHKEIIKTINSVTNDIIDRTEFANSNSSENKNYLPNNFSANSFFNSNQKKEYINSGLIFCPHKSAKINSGVDAIVNLLKTEVEENKLPLKIGYFYGSGDDDDFQANSKEELIIEQHQTDFVANKSNLLVATKAFGMGIDKANIRFTIHYNYPNSIESFIQEAGRAGRDRKTAINYILLCSQPDKDRSILESFFDNAFRGRNKEVRILAELLTEITFPFASASHSIYTELENEFGIDVYFSFYQQHGNNRIYINEAYQRGYGYIDLNWNFQINTNQRHTDFSQELSVSILEFTKNYILQNCPDATNTINWLKQQNPQSNKDGIEKRLNRLKLNETIELTIGFQNDKLFLIHTLLQAIDFQFSFPLIKKAVKYCKTSQEFIGNIEKEYWIATQQNIKIPTEQYSTIDSYFKNIRDNSDTSRAIYRLSIIGVIDDYEIDYNSKTYKIIITKRPDNYYIEKLKNYFAKYISKQRTEKEISKIETGEAQGNSTIQKCLNLLTHFVYNEIVSKRKEAIKSMEFAAELGLEDPERMREHIQLYFNAKYLRDYEFEGKIYNLLEDTENGKDYNSTLLWKYLSVTYGAIENLKHLLGSAERLLNENRKNAALLLMKAFSLILLNITPDGKIKNQKFIKEAEENFVEGLFIFSDEKDEYDTIIQGFKKYLVDYNPETLTVIENILEVLNVRQILNPLRDFNNKFLRTYETRKYSNSSKRN